MPESFGFRLGRGITTTLAEILDLVPDALRQSDSMFTGNAPAHSSRNCPGRPRTDGQKKLARLLLVKPQHA
jgi:hypothetical protein